MNSSNRKGNDLIGIIIISIIFILILLTIIIGPLFKSENKLKLAFQNNQTISLYTAIYNEKKEITHSIAFFYKPETNRISAFYMLPGTYIYIPGTKKYARIQDMMNNNISREYISKSISYLLGKEINYYFFIKESNFIKLIDRIGGIQIFTEGLEIPQNNIYFSNGLNTFDGEKSLQYISVLSEGEDEYDHLKRNQNFFRSFVDIQPDFLEKFNETNIVKYIYPLFETNITVNDSIVVFKQLKLRFENGISNYGENMINNIVYCDKDKNNDMTIYIPKQSGKWVKGLVEDSINSLSMKKTAEIGSEIEIQVLNGTEIVGFAFRTQRYLESYGFIVTQIGNSNEKFTHTAIKIGSSENKSNILANLIRCKNIITPSADENINEDAILILGNDFDGKYVK